MIHKKLITELTHLKEKIAGAEASKSGDSDSDTGCVKRALRGACSPLFPVLAVSWAFCP